MTELQSIFIQLTIFLFNSISKVQQEKLSFSHKFLMNQQDILSACDFMTIFVGKSIDESKCRSVALLALASNVRNYL